MLFVGFLVRPRRWCDDLSSFFFFLILQVSGSIAFQTHLQPARVTATSTGQIAMKFYTGGCENLLGKSVLV